MPTEFKVQEPIVHRRLRIPGHLKNVPWSLVADHDHQAHKNHSQSLAVLNRRGGCSPCEILAIIEDRPWSKMDPLDAHQRLLAYLEVPQEPETGAG